MSTAVSPVGAFVLVPANVTIDPFAMVGASLMGLMVSFSAAVAAEICVVPPVVPVRSSVVPLVIACPLSIRLALSAVAQH